jgi:hypothetical protein
MLRSEYRCRRDSTLELFDAFQGTFLECRRFACDRGFAGSLHLRNAAIEGGNQLEQFTDGSGTGHVFHGHFGMRFVRVGGQVGRKLRRAGVENQVYAGPNRRRPCPSRPKL